MEFLTTLEAAKLLRVAKSTLERMRVQGGGPRFIKTGPGKRSRVLYRLAEINAWLEKHYPKLDSITTARVTDESNPALP